MHYSTFETSLWKLFQAQVDNTSASEMSEREEKIKREVKTDEYGNVRKEEVRREVDTKSEAERDLEDAGDKIKAGARSIGAKMEDTDKDLGAQYEKKKAEEKLKD